MGDLDNARDAELQAELKAHGRLPAHIAIIMDGNGRWAERRHLTRSDGHRSARDVVRETVRACGELGIDILTLFTFGTENWKRPWGEVLSLMQLLRDCSVEELPELLDNNVRLVTTGETHKLAKHARLALESAIRSTSKNTGLTLNLALSYDGRSDIVQAAQHLARAIARGEISVDDVDHETFSRYLLTSGLPDPDLMIRTSGEVRLSNFMLWQCAYTEFHFTSVFWPDFERCHLYEAISTYQSKERRFGQTSAQLRSNEETIGEPAGVSTA